MASSKGTRSPSIISSPTSTTCMPCPPLVEKSDKDVAEIEVVQGGIFWLPAKSELPEKAVRRAHGRGAVEEGIHNHPVVVLSRPAEDPSMVHFLLITSFQGRRLDEMYGKPNDFHASRRSWYLPVSPTPDHPDANSKKSKKRFPTLHLASGATLRWNSYVNLRHVYKVAWRHLRPIENPDMPWCSHFQFDKESMIRMLAKERGLTNYEVDKQYDEATSAHKAESFPPPTASTDDDTDLLDEAVKENGTIASADPRNCWWVEKSDFQEPWSNGVGQLHRPPKAPPDDANWQGCIVATWVMFGTSSNTLDDSGLL